ncbi:MAG: hypothetical protein M0036_01815 [Desulfobacteraceae bacterium]|nr:hypothetical protein [Desulfobacteraceae bacterium]
MKRVLMILFCLGFFACSNTQRIDYSPNFGNLKDPISLIKITLEQQPPAYAYVPVKVEVTDQLMTLYLVESGIPSPFNSGSSIVPKILYYRNLGDPKLSKSTKYPIWHVEIYDKLGNDLYWVYTQDEREAKEFIDSLCYMIKKAK